MHCDADPSSPITAASENIPIGRVGRAKDEQSNCFPPIRENKIGFERRWNDFVVTIWSSRASKWATCESSSRWFGVVLIWRVRWSTGKVHLCQLGCIWSARLQSASLAYGRLSADISQPSWQNTVELIDCSRVDRLQLSQHVAAEMTSVIRDNRVQLSCNLCKSCSWHGSWVDGFDLS